MLTFRRTVLGFVLLVSAVCAQAADLSVEITTLYLPGVDFVQTAAVLREADPPNTALGVLRVTAFVGDDYVNPKRIGEFSDLSPGHYTLFLSLRDVFDLQIAFRQFDVVIGESDEVVTILVVRPEGTAEKTAELLVDLEGDGAVNAGDTLRFTATTTGAASLFEDRLSPTLSLVSGSVITDGGSVVTGNDPGDTVVRVTGAMTEVRYDAVVTPRAVNQGHFEIGGPSAKRRIATDDPSQPGDSDPTLVEVICDSGGCAADLTRCEEDLAQCEADRDDLMQELTTCESARDSLAEDLATCTAERGALQERVATLESQLGALLDDGDEDAVPAVLDLCDGTPGGVAVDERGCSQEQFCVAVGEAWPSQPEVCNDADWLGDEPRANPRDCRQHGAVCQAS